MTKKLLGKIADMVAECLIEARMHVYHGTSADFRVFKAVKRDSHPSKVGIWFASTVEAATHIAGGTRRMADDRPRVIMASIRLEQPMRFETYRDFLDAYQDCGNDAGKLRKKLMRAGYDGVEITRSDTDGAGDRTDYAVFEPWQIDIIRSENVA